MAKITYENKVDIRISPKPRKNKVTADDMNEIKASVNNLYDNPSTGEVTVATNQTITGQKTFTQPVLIGSSITKNDQNLDVLSGGVRIVSLVPVAQYTACFFDYSIKRGPNVRAGIVIATHDGVNTVFNEVSTQDLGNTAGVVFSVDVLDGNLRLLVTADTNNWVIKTFTRGI